VRPITQTSVYPHGNCFQTCVACVLDLDLDAVPPQARCDHTWTDAKGERRYGPYFANLLGRYLRKHHGLLYIELDVSTAGAAFAPRGYHFLVGKTVRSEQQGNCAHIVVADRGEMIWDPHPSHAGLVGPTKMAALVPFPPEYVDYWDRSEPEHPCQCPACCPEGIVCGCPECAATG